MLQRIVLFILCSLIIANTVQAQSGQIILDENFSDWPDSPLYTDPVDDGGSSDIDFQQFWMSHDPMFLFLRIKLGEELNLQSNNDITIYLDTDDNPDTGLSIHGMGAELSYNFGNRSGVVRLDGDIIEVYHDDLFLVSSPTVTSDEFEIAFDRNVTFNGEPLFSLSTVRAVWRDESLAGDDLPDTGSVEYQIAGNNQQDLPTYTIEREDPSNLRILSYNVQFDGFFENPKKPRFNRILDAILPDIIGFQEIYDHSSAQTAALVEEHLPSGPGEQWYHDKAGPDIIAVSRYPIDATYTITGGSSGGVGNGAFLIDLRPVYQTHLLFLVAHTPCCDDDYNRQLEIDAMMAFVRDAKLGTGPLDLPEGTPIVIVGDMNLVGDNAQLETLVTGNIVNNSSYGPDFFPDWDGSDLEDSKPLVTNLPMTFTWFDGGSSFSPGRLDFMLYTGASLELENTYTLFTPTLLPAQLQLFNLQTVDAILASDHLPLVGDFQVTVQTSADELVAEDPFDMQIWPNPATDSIQLGYRVEMGGQLKMELVNLEGKVMRSEVFYQASGEYHKTLSLIGLPSGQYLLRLVSPTGISVGELLIVR